jgi:putative membrane protein
MKTMKAIPHFLVAGTLLLGAACSSSKTSSDTASGSGVGAVPSTEASTATTSTTTPAAETSVASTGSTSDTGSGAVAASDVPAGDLAVFMGTFATMTDPVFLINAGSSNILEIQTGQMAAQKATSPDVRRFAQMMVTLHTQNDQELKALANELNVTLPTTMLPVHQHLADRMLDKTGKGFDESYMDLMEKAHKLDIAMFDVKSKKAEMPAVKSFATRNLPLLRSRRTLADKIENKVD